MYERPIVDMVGCKEKYPWHLLRTEIRKFNKFLEMDQILDILRPPQLLFLSRLVLMQNRISSLSVFYYAKISRVRNVLPLYSISNCKNDI